MNRGIENFRKYAGYGVGAVLLAALLLPWGKLGKYKYVYPFYNEDGLVAVQSRGGKWGYIDEDKNEIIPCIYFFVGSNFNKGIAVQLNGKCGFIDPTGKEIIPPVYDYVRDLRSNLSNALKGESRLYAVLNDENFLFDRLGNKLNISSNGVLHLIR